MPGEGRFCKVHAPFCVVLIVQEKGRSTIMLLLVLTLLPAVIIAQDDNSTTTDLPLDVTTSLVADDNGTTEAFLTTELVTTVATVGPVPSALDITEIFFEGIDQDNDDLIERADVDNYFYNNYDTDGDFEVSFSEFDAYISATRPEMIPIAHAAFNKFDIHQNGFLDDEDLTVAFIAADSNGDDNVSRLEFYTVFEPAFEDVLLDAASATTVPTVATATVPADTTGAVSADTTATVAADTTAAVPADTTGAVSAVTTGAVSAVTTGAVSAVTTGAVSAVTTAAVPTDGNVTVPGVPSALNITEMWFDAIDIDDDDMINRADFDVYFLNNYDTDGDTEVSLVEFDAYFAANRPELLPIENATFSKLDTQQNGFLDDDDFTMAFDDADSDGDDVVTRQEFITVYEPVFEEVLAEVASS